jgi:hypothetical protein
VKSSSALKFLLPLLLACGGFAWLDVYRYGWDTASDGGADPWAIMFTAMGGAAIPALIAIVISTLMKIIRRATSFSNVWVASFLPIFAIVFALNLIAHQSVRANNIADNSNFENDCPLKGAFSDAAVISKLQTAKELTGKAWRIVEIYPDGYSSLDCYMIRPIDMFGNMSEMDILIWWATQEGLDQEGIFSVDTPYPHSRMLSTKSVAGRAVELEHRLFLFPDAFVLTVTAGDPQDFPNERNKAFSDSLSVNLGRN